MSMNNNNSHLAAGRQPGGDPGVGQQRPYHGAFIPTQQQQRSPDIIPIDHVIANYMTALSQNALQDVHVQPALTVWNGAGPLPGHDLSSDDRHFQRSGQQHLVRVVLQARRDEDARTILNPNNVVLPPMAVEHGLATREMEGLKAVQVRFRNLPAPLFSIEKQALLEQIRTHVVLPKLRKFGANLFDVHSTGQEAFGDGSVVIRFAESDTTFDRGWFEWTSLQNEVPSAGGRGNDQSRMPVTSRESVTLFEFAFAVEKASNKKILDLKLAQPHRIEEATAGSSTAAATEVKVRLVAQLAILQDLVSTTPEFTDAVLHEIYSLLGLLSEKEKNQPAVVNAATAFLPLFSHSSTHGHASQQPRGALSRTHSVVSGSSADAEEARTNSKWCVDVTALAKRGCEIAKITDLKTALLFPATPTPKHAHKLSVCGRTCNRKCQEQAAALRQQHKAALGAITKEKVCSDRARMMFLMSLVQKALEADGRVAEHLGPGYAKFERYVPRMHWEVVFDDAGTNALISARYYLPPLHGRVLLEDGVPGGLRLTHESLLSLSLARERLNLPTGGEATSSSASTALDSDAGGGRGKTTREQLVGKKRQFLEDGKEALEGYLVRVNKALGGCLSDETAKLEMKAAFSVLPEAFAQAGLDVSPGETILTSFSTYSGADSKFSSPDEVDATSGAVSTSTPNSLVPVRLREPTILLLNGERGDNVSRDILLDHHEEDVRQWFEERDTEIEVRIDAAYTWHDWKDRVLADRPDVWYYFGHTQGQEFLNRGLKLGSREPVLARDLNLFLRELVESKGAENSLPSLVVLLGCHTLTVGKVLESFGIPTVCCPQTPSREQACAFGLDLLDRFVTSILVPPLSQAVTAHSAQLQFSSDTVPPEKDVLRLRIENLCQRVVADHVKATSLQLSSPSEASDADEKYQAAQRTGQKSRSGPQLDPRKKQLQAEKSWNIDLKNLKPLDYKYFHREEEEDSTERDPLLASASTSAPTVETTVATANSTTIPLEEREFAILTEPAGKAMTMEMAVKLQAKLDELDRREGQDDDSCTRSPLFWWVAGGLLLLLVAGSIGLVYYFCVLAPKGGDDANNRGGSHGPGPGGPVTAKKPPDPYTTLTEIYQQKAADPSISSFELAQYPTGVVSDTKLSGDFGSGQKDWEEWVQKTYKAVKLYEAKCAAAPAKPPGGRSSFLSHAESRNKLQSPYWCDAARVSGKATKVLQYDLEKAAGYAGLAGVYPLVDKMQAEKNSGRNPTDAATEAAQEEQDAGDVAVLIRNLGGLQMAQRLISHRMDLEEAPFLQQIGDEQVRFPFAVELVERTLNAVQKNVLWDTTLARALTCVDPRFANRVRMGDGRSLQRFFADVFRKKRGTFFRDAAHSGNPTLQSGLHRHIFSGVSSSAAEQELARDHSLSYYQKQRLLQAARAEEVRNVVTKVHGDAMLDTATFAFLPTGVFPPTVAVGYRIRRADNPTDAGLTAAGAAFGTGTLREGPRDEMLEWQLFSPAGFGGEKRETALRSAKENLGEEKCNEPVQVPPPQRGRSSAYHRLCWKMKAGGDHLSPIDTWTPHIRLRRDLIAGPFWTLGGVGPKTFYLVPLPKAAWRYMVEYKHNFEHPAFERMLKRVTLRHANVVEDVQKFMETKNLGRGEDWYREMFLTPDYPEVLENPDKLDFGGYWVYNVGTYEPDFLASPYRSFMPDEFFSWSLGPPAEDK
ncbi:unnamed protein product [Amoebophrya sp. A120]|nr:unnamed protein product [Amoebophrya sp. A120]|eukprot:GSA120T00005710001.1